MGGEFATILLCRRGVQVVAEVLALLQQMFGISGDSFPRPVDFVVSRWDEDCFSRGSYSTPVR